jgi:hypothetical protein
MQQFKLWLATSLGFCSYVYFQEFHMNKNMVILSFQFFKNKL